MVAAGGVEEDAARDVAKDLFISFGSTTISLPPAVSQALMWGAGLHWWEWLLVVKGIVLFWVLNITIVLPSVFMQVMLYTDEMTSRHAPSTVTLLREGQRLLTLILNPPASAIEEETQQIGAKGRRFSNAHRRKRKCYKT
ncbi:uncharacterized protein LOC126997553 [Eriocheir sinensis]|uniref:uncharacterized protein LOC126997553 n=1 Tax=Eriocheir sinensis TaxID=95602 RepID=UPI0021CA9273|nr:uncharacterized protein LOC126997553 [Eriocheir sinensis]